jgi:hypothetical protein
MAAAIALVAAGGGLQVLALGPVLIAAVAFLGDEARLVATDARHAPPVEVAGAAPWHREHRSAGELTPARIDRVQDAVSIITAYTHLILNDEAMGHAPLSSRTHAMLGRILASTAQVQKSLTALVDELGGADAPARPPASSPDARRS